MTRRRRRRVEAAGRRGPCVVAVTWRVDRVEAAAEGLEDGPGATLADARAELGRILVRAAAGELSPLRRSGKAQPLPEAAAFLEND